MLAWAVAPLGLALAAVVVGTLGGFEQRTDLLRPTPAGEQFVTGPYELRFTHATAQQHVRYDGSRRWEVRMIGEGRTTGTESITPHYFGNGGMFLSKDPASGEVRDPEGLDFGADDSDRDSFTPGLPPVPFVVGFEYETYLPGPTIRFAVYDLEYGNHLLVGEEEGWHNLPTGRVLDLPVRVLPPDMT